MFKEIVNKFETTPLRYLYGLIIILLILFIFVLIPLSKNYMNNGSKNFTIKDNYFGVRLGDEDYRSDFIDLNSIITNIFNSNNEKFEVTLTIIGDMIVGNLNRNFSPWCYSGTPGEDGSYEWKSKIDMSLNLFNKNKVKIKTISLYERRSNIIKYYEERERDSKYEMIIEFEDSDENNKEIYNKTRYIQFESESWCRN